MDFKVTALCLLYLHHAIYQLTMATGKMFHQYNCHSVHPIAIFYFYFSIFSELSLYINSQSFCNSNSLHGFMGVIRMENIPSLKVNSLAAR